jgi:hypothetical protein
VVAVTSAGRLRDKCGPADGCARRARPSRPALFVVVPTHVCTLCKLETSLLAVRSAW